MVLVLSATLKKKRKLQFAQIEAWVGLGRCNRCDTTGIDILRKTIIDLFILNSFE